MTCPSCGTEGQAGKYCAECGAALKLECPSCGRVPPPGSTFCPACGQRLAAGGGRTSQPVWWIGAAAAAVVVVVLLIPERADRAGPRLMTDPEVEAPFPGMSGLSADMRTNADRLFNRVMAAAEQGEMTEVSQFLPMAIQAYEMVDRLDDDGLYHLAVLYLTAGDHAQAMITAEEILDGNPNHVLGLGVMGEAAVAMGDVEAATAYYRRLLEGFADESGHLRPEYVDHETMLRHYRDAAREYLAGR